MQIKTLNELREFLREFEINTSNNKNLWAASCKFNYVEDLKLDPNRMAPCLGLSNFGREEIDIGRDLFLHFYSVGTEHQRAKSLLDMNVPENGYNDWRLFTTKEEAEKHANPLKWELGAIYKVADQRKRESYWGLGGELECVFVDDELEKCLLKNHKGLHLLSIHMLESFTKVR